MKCDGFLQGVPSQYNQNQHYTVAVLYFLLSVPFTGRS